MGITVHHHMIWLISLTIIRISLRVSFYGKKPRQYFFLQPKNQSLNTIITPTRLSLFRTAQFHQHSQVYIFFAYSPWLGSFSKSRALYFSSNQITQISSFITTKFESIFCTYWNLYWISFRIVIFPRNAQVHQEIGFWLSVESTIALNTKGKNVESF